MTKIFEKLFKYIESEDVKGLIRYCLILLPFVGGGILGMGFLVKYITIHKEALILLGVAACMILPAFMGKPKDKSTPKTVATNDNMTFFDRLLVKDLFIIFTSYAQQFRIISPLRYSDLRDTLPSGMDFGKGIAVYRFKVMADGEPISQADFHEILTIHIEERLASGELALGKPTAEFEGKLYQKVFIDECICAGGVWHICLIICDNAKAAHYIDAKQQALIMRNSRVSRQYEDSDF